MLRGGHPLGCQAAYRFPELRIRLVRDDHYVWKQPSLVEFAVVEMQCSECGSLKYPIELRAC
jgi:hypothetical protein